ncbi:MAG: transglutaminase-like domain-containing protein [Terriglobales bacterium]|jgi:hypothetical protein
MDSRQRFQQPEARTEVIALRLVVLLLLSLSLLAQENPAETPDMPSKEIWAQSLLSGQPAGFYHEKAELSANHDVDTLIESQFVFNRLGSKLEMKFSSQYEEGSDGSLLGVKTEMTSSNQTTHTEASVKASQIHIATSTGGKTYERDLPFTGNLLGPEAGRRLVLAHLKSTGDTISYQTFYPELGVVATITETLVGDEELTIGTNHWPSLKVEQAISEMPGKATLWLDRDGWLLRQLVPSAFGDLEAIRSEAKVADNTAGASIPAESFARTVVHSNIRLPEERLLEGLKIRINHRKPELGWPDLAAENQTILDKTPDHVILEIRRPALPANGVAERPVRMTPALAPFLSPNALLQADDANVQRIAADVVVNDKDLFRSARGLQNWTHQNMHFDLGIAVVPASEVARDRRGTCIGYAVLLGALARATGIPSRVRIGYAYADGSWGGHAWIDVLDGDSWVPLDSALYSPGPADAARISFFTTSLEEGTITQVGSLAKLAGNIDIQILEYTVNGKHVVVPDDAKPYVVEANTYRNSWMGLVVSKPTSFRFTKLDADWPDETVVAMEGPQHELVEVQSLSDSLPASDNPDLAKYLEDAGIKGKPVKKQIAGHNAVMISAPDLAGITLMTRGNIWLLKASGPKASERLMEVASTVRLDR